MSEDLEELKKRLGEPMTTDYCLRCGCSPDAGEHTLGKCEYLDPRIHPYSRARSTSPGPGKAFPTTPEAWLPHIFADPHFRAAIEACDKILMQKGADYTQKQPDRLANFKEAAKYLGQSDFQVLGVYLYKHLTAVFSFLKHGQVESEPIEGRIYDCINYLLLLFKMVQEHKESVSVQRAILLEGRGDE